MCKAISVKSAVQKSGVGGAKKCGRGLEKKPYPVKCHFEMNRTKSYFAPCNEAFAVQLIFYLNVTRHFPKVENDLFRFL
jgi:hypothetical protein